MSLKNFKGAVLDLDGVITNTAKLHFKAWKEIFDQFLKSYHAGEQGSESEIQNFSKDDYLTYVDGKSRYQGVRSFLDSRQIELEFGDEADVPAENSVCALANKKNNRFRELIDEEGVEVFDSTIRFMDTLKQNGIKLGVASASRNSRLILKKTKLIEEFESIIGGKKAQEMELKSKPEPDIFIAAAEEMGFKPSECLMVEDAISGVRAGRKGNFACVIGIAREDIKDELRRYGGDFIIEDMKEISWDDLKNWFEQGLYEDSWQLKYYGFDQMEEKLRETLTTVGNGYFATRGCFVGEKATKDIHYPGTYIAGLYNKVPTVIHDKKIYNNDLVNCPNWLLIEFKIGKEKYLDILKTKILYYEHQLNMKTGLMWRKIKFQDAKGRITTIEVERFASMDNPHLAGIRFKLTPDNYFETVSLRSTLDGTVSNFGVPRYRSLSGNHLNPVKQEEKENGIFLHVRTNQSDVDVYMLARHQFYTEDEEARTSREVETAIEQISEIFSFDCKQNKTYVLEKTLSVFTSKDRDTEDPENELNEILDKKETFDVLFSRSKAVWKNLWDRADFIIHGDRFSQRVTRLHIYHLLTTANIHNKDLDVGLPARGWHGEAYRGHIFWDEIFMMPFYNLNLPQVSKSALLYRYRRLDAAREYARENGYEGAMYPWQTANEGTEETQKIHYNPVSGEWDPDLSRLQRHVSIAIAYNVLEYCHAKADKDFMKNYGAEMLFEIARFWASIAEFDERDKKYHIRNVMGPDEFQEKYPGAENGGIDDNAYTNIMVSWLFDEASGFYEKFDNESIRMISEKISLKPDEIEQWGNIRDNLFVEINENEIIAQFKGYFDLKEIEWQKYKEKYDDVRRMDRILKAENDSPNKYKVAKQADVLMAFYLLSPQQLKDILQGMGYEVEDAKQFLEKNYHYYLKRTSHGSTLSYVVQAALQKYLARKDRSSWEWFLNALNSDVFDTQGGTTEEGIHTGVMAGTIDIIVQSFAGLELFKDHMEVNPSLPKHWDELIFNVYHCDKAFRISLNHNNFVAELLSGEKYGFFVEHNNKRFSFEKSTKLKIPLN